MAQVTVKRRLVNPARRKRNAGARRKLTLAQRLAGFGGKRSQAAAKAAKSRKRKGNPKRKAAAAPKKKVSTRAKARPKKTAAKRNPPSRVISYALENPAPSKGGKSMAAKRKTTRTKARKSNPARTTRRSAPRKAGRRRSSNPAKTTRRRRHSNPRGSGLTSMITSAGYLLAGAVGARAATQLVLGAKNVGAIGYAANLAASFVLGGLVGKVMKNKAAGKVIIQGGVMGTALRAIQDFTPLGSVVNANLGVAGIRGDIGVGFISPRNYQFFPLSQDGEGNSIPPALPAAAAPPNGMQGVRSHMGRSARY